MNRTLKARIERLERRKKQRPMPRIVLAIFDRTDDEVCGYQAGNLVAMRAPGEALAEVQVRAWALGGPGITLEALYRPENRPAIDVAEVTGTPFRHG